MKSRMRGIIAFTLIMVIFVGCAGGNHKRSTGEYIDDASITTKVKSAFAADPTVSAMDVKVKTYKGVVQLSGFVDTAEQAQKAEEIAEDVQGVVSVQNDIIVKSR